MRSLSLTARTTIRTADVSRLILPISQRHVRSRFDLSSSGFECHLLVLKRTKSKVAGSAVVGCQEPIASGSVQPRTGSRLKISSDPKAFGKQPFKKSSDKMGLLRSWSNAVLSVVFRQAFECISSCQALKSPSAKLVLDRV